MLTIIHISDTHFHRNDPDNRLVVDRLISIQNEEFLSSNEVYLMVTGDIVDDGHDVQFANAARALSLFPRTHCLVAPGNHDYGASGIFYDPVCARRFDKLIASPMAYTRSYFEKMPIVRVLRDAKGRRLMTIGINACLETVHSLDFSCGEVGERQLKQLDAILNNPEAAAIPKLVYLHFHPFDRGRGLKLRDSAAFMECVKGRVAALCFGHKHEQKLWSGPNQYEIPWIAAAGSLRDDSGKKYFRIKLVDEGKLEVEEGVILS